MRLAELGPVDKFHQCSVRSHCAPLGPLERLRGILIEL